MKKSIIIIPARGGSKSIPKKNLQLVNGLTLIERAVKGALKIENSQVIVSTDDNKIMNQVSRYPIKVYKRSGLNSSDDASSESVILEVLDNYQFFDGVVVLLQATSPFLDIIGLRDSIEFLQESEKVDSMFSAISKNLFSWEFQDEWLPVNHSRNFRTRRQLRPPIAVETGSFYLFKAQKFQQEKTRFCGVTIPAFTKSWSDFDIDSKEDLQLCRDLSSVLDFPPYLV